MDVKYFKKEENNGEFFCKIGKSEPHIGKGGYLDYEKYKGEIISLNSGEITFEKLNDVIKFFHYGDELVIFDFSIEKKELETAKYWADEINKGCYQGTILYIKDVISLKDPSTIDFIVENATDKTNLKELWSSAKGHLEDKGFFDSANRLEELMNHI